MEIFVEILIVVCNFLFVLVKNVFEIFFKNKILIIIRDCVIVLYKRLGN